MKKLEDIENEIKQVRADLADNISPNIERNKDTQNQQLAYTMDDLWEAFGRKHRYYATRLRNALKQQGITTLAEFLAMTPGQLLDLDGIGPGTLQYANKALKKMGIQW